MWDRIRVSCVRGGGPGDKRIWRYSRKRLEDRGSRGFTCLEERKRSRGGWCELGGSVWE